MIGLKTIRRKNVNGVRDAHNSDTIELDLTDEAGESSQSEPLLESSNDLTSNCSLSHYDKKALKRLNKKIDVLICVAITSLVILTVIVISGIVGYIYARPLIDKSDSLIDQTSELISKFNNMDLSVLDDLKQNLPDIISTIQKFKNVDVNAWDQEISAIRDIRQHLQVYDGDIQTILNYMQSFSKILQNFQFLENLGVNS